MAPVEKWTDEMHQMIRENHPRLKTQELITLLGQKTGRWVTRNAMLGKIWRLGLAKKETDSSAPKTKPIRIRKRKIRITSHQLPDVPPPIASPRKPQTAPVVGAVHIRDLNSRHCRWMDGEVSSLMFCGKPTIATTSWCAEHLPLIYQPRPRR